MRDSDRIQGCFIAFLLLFLLISLVSCAKVQKRICIKDGTQYCVTADRIYVVNWDACYRRGVSCMEGACWDYAIEEFNQAVDLRYKDQRHARAYGMHFREEYFPHRELGICNFRLGKIQEALAELELSMSQTPSARAKYYLNQVRRSDLLETGKDIEPPVIHMEFPEEAFLVNQTPFQLKGIVQDDRYVAAISINQKPFFMELAEPSIPFAVPIVLEEGWNSIRIVAKDLVDRESVKRIRIYLDQQGPMVIVNPIEPDQTVGLDQVRITAVVYDRSGIVSFKLDQREVPRLGVEQIFLIEQAVPVLPGAESIPFWTQDRAGNITQGEIALFSAQKRPGYLTNRLACRDPDLELLAMLTKEKGISFDITHPPQEDLTTYYKEVFLEGRIETQKGIKRIAVNDRQIFDVAEVQAAIEDNMQNLINMLIQKDKEPERYIDLLQEVVRSYNTYHINQRIPLMEEFTTLNLLVEDTLGNQGTKIFHIQRIPREAVFKSEQRMILALLPLDSVTAVESDLQRYIYNKFIESFINDGRFNLVEREKLPWVIIEKTIQSGDRVYQEDIAQEIGEMASAEGVICGYIQKRADGTEILARFVEVDTGLIRLFHDVFTPSEEIKNIHTITSGLAMKFRDSFPVCTGTIIAKKGKTIHVDTGSEERIFPGMRFNIFKDERELIGQASIREAGEGFSEAEIQKGDTSRDIDVGHWVRTR